MIEGICRLRVRVFNPEKLIARVAFADTVDAVGGQRIELDVVHSVVERRYEEDPLDSAELLRDVVNDARLDGLLGVVID